MGIFIEVNKYIGATLTVDLICSIGTFIANVGTESQYGLSTISTPIYLFRIHPNPRIPSLDGFYVGTIANPSSDIYANAIAGESSVRTYWNTSHTFTKDDTTIYVCDFSPANQTNYDMVISQGNAFTSFEDMVSNFPLPVETYPITYSYTNATVSGPSEAAIGDTVTVSAVPDVDYGITDASTQILVTNNDVAVPYTWDSVNNRITFTMPDPS